MRLRHANVKAIAPALLLALAGGTAASGQTYVWSGASGSDWNTTNTLWSGSSWVSSNTAVAEFPPGITGTIWLRENVTLNDMVCKGNWTIMPTAVLTLAGTGSVINVIPGATLNLKVPVAGSVGLTKTGGGVFTLMQPCTYSGPTTISEGVLQFRESGALPSNSELALSAGVQVWATQADDSYVISALTGAGQFITDGMHLPVITLLGTAANPVSSAAFQGNTFRMVKNSAGLQTLSGTSTYPLGTTINGGMLIAAGNTAFGTGAVTVNSGATWGVRGNITQANAGSIGGNGTLDSSGAIHNIDGNNTLTGGISITEDFTIGAVSGSLTLTNTLSCGVHFARVNTAAGAVVSVPTFNTLPAVTKNGAGELRLTAASGMSNGIDINEGLVTLGHDSALNGATVLFATGGAGLRVNGRQASIGVLAGGDSVAYVDNGNAAPGVLTISPASGSWTFNGLLLDGQNSGALGLTKLGGGEQIFAMFQVHTGPTTVTAGTLTFNGTVGASPVTINGGTLAGNGRIASTVTMSSGVLTGSRIIGGLLTVSGGTVKPAGASQGALTLSSGLTATGGTFEMQGPAPTSGYDQILVTGGDVSLGNGVATLAYSTSGSAGYTLSDRIVVISNTGSGTTSGFFAGLPEGAVVASLAGFGAQAQWKISYHFDLATGSSTGGNDVVLRPVAPSGIVNGGFETGTGSLGLLNAGSTAMQGWTVTRGNIEWLDTATWAAPEGARSLDLNGVNSAGGVMQVVNLPSGARHRLKFTMAGNPDGGPAVKNMGVRVNGTVVPFSFDTTGHTRADMGWTEHSMVLAGTGDNMEIEFYSTDAPSYQGVTLDNVRLIAEPCVSDIAGLGTSPGGDGQLTVDDLVFFLSRFFANDRDRCDLVVMGGAVGSDGQVTVDDLVAFLQGFFAGCP